LTTNLELIDTK